MGPSYLPRPVIVRWPDQAELRRACAELGTPCLLVVGPGGELPALGPLEDAVRAGDGELDAAARLARLLAAPADASAHGPAPMLGEDPSTEVRAVRRVIGLLRARPERLLPWLDLAPASAVRAEVAAEAARALDGAGWWVEVLDGIGVLAGPTGELVS